MATRRDAIGNVIGRYGAGDRPFVLGSHFDTVPDAGSFDGPLGILAGIAVVERLTAGGAQPSAPVEVVAFADEEGMRFGTAFLGSAAYAGLFEPAWLELVDRDGITLEDAVRAAGGRTRVPRSGCPSRSSPHTSSCTSSRGRCSSARVFPWVSCPRSSATRARTSPSAARRGTPGQCRWTDGATRSPLRRRSCSPSSASAAGPRGSSRRSAGWTSSPAPPTSSPAAPVSRSTSVTPPTTSARARSRGSGASSRTWPRSVRSRSISRSRGSAPPSRLSSDLRGDLARAIAALDHPVRELASGAGHDAAVLSRICPAAMLFVRCAGGISHDPRESVDEGDVAVALDVLEGAVRAM